MMIVFPPPDVWRLVASLLTVGQLTSLYGVCQLLRTVCKPLLQRYTHVRPEDRWKMLVRAVHDSQPSYILYCFWPQFPLLHEHVAMAIAEVGTRAHVERFLAALPELQCDMACALGSHGREDCVDLLTAPNCDIFYEFHHAIGEHTDSLLGNRARALELLHLDAKPEVLLTPDVGLVCGCHQLWDFAMLHRRAIASLPNQRWHVWRAAVKHDQRKVAEAYFDTSLLTDLLRSTTEALACGHYHTADLLLRLCERYIDPDYFDYKACLVFGGSVDDPGIASHCLSVLGSATVTDNVLEQALLYAAEASQLCPLQRLYDTYAACRNLEDDVWWRCLCAREDDYQTAEWVLARLTGPVASADRLEVLVAREHFHMLHLLVLKGYLTFERLRAMRLSVYDCEFDLERLLRAPTKIKTL